MLLLGLVTFRHAPTKILHTNTKSCEGPEIDRESKVWRSRDILAVMAASERHTTLGLWLCCLTTSSPDDANLNGPRIESRKVANNNRIAMALIRNNQSENRVEPWKPTYEEVFGLRQAPANPSWSRPTTTLHQFTSLPPEIQM